MSRTITFTDEEITTMSHALTIASKRYLALASQIRDESILEYPKELTGRLLERAGLAAALLDKVVRPPCSITMPIKKNGADIGSVIFDAGANAGAFTFASAVTFEAGDVLSHG